MAADVEGGAGVSACLWVAIGKGAAFGEICNAGRWRPQRRLVGWGAVTSNRHAWWLQAVVGIDGPARLPSVVVRAPVHDVGEPFVAVQRSNDQRQFAAVLALQLLDQVDSILVPARPEQLGCGPNAGVAQQSAVGGGQVLVEQRLVEPVDQP